MEIEEYEHLAKIEENNWWHVGRIEILDQELNRNLPNTGTARKILNIGAGPGGTIPMLMKHGTVTNIDSSPEAIKFAKERGITVKKGDATNLTNIKDETFDVICAFDVLEHIEDDAAVLKEWKRVLKPGGRIVLSVPAYNWLWSTHDEICHHYRRYTLRYLNNLVALQGYKIIRSSYAIVFSTPLIAGYRVPNKLLKKAGLKKESQKADTEVAIPPAINKAFTKILMKEASLHGHMRFPFGTSVILTAEKI